MPKSIQIFKGGLNRGHEDRLVVNQRPADGHIKPAAWEDHIRVNKKRIRTNDMHDLEVDDELALHTALTFGLVEAWGIAVVAPEPGLKFKLTTNDDDFDLDSFAVITFQRQPDGNYTKTAEGTAADTELEATDETYYLILPDAGTHHITVKPTFFGLKITALPSDGLLGVFDLESRFQSRQPVRPPACLECC